LLSTYCNEELTGRQQVEVREHLAGCAECRREASAFQSISDVASELSQKALSEDFNTRLLNRIAEERFSETRTRAYLPRRAPIISWRLVAPAVASVALVLFAAVSMLMPSQQQGVLNMASVSDRMDNLYRTVQPGNNPNMTVNPQKDWSLGKQIATTERFSRISNMLTDSQGFGNMHLTSVSNLAHTASARIPYHSGYFKIQPIIRVYENSGKNASEEGENAY